MKLNDFAPYREIAKIAIPATLESLLVVAVAFIDTQMVSALGEKAISAVSFTTQPKIFVISIFFALGTALSVSVAQARGKNDSNEAKEYFFSTVKITIILGLVLGAILFMFARPIMELCSRQTDTVELSANFYGIVMGFMIFKVLSIVLNSSLRGLGKTNVALYAGIALSVVDILFNYLLIEGRYGFPRLEITGNAIATVLGSVASLAVSFAAIRKQNDFLNFEGFFEHKLLKNWDIIAKIKSMAGNIVVENLAMRLGFIICSVIVSLFQSLDTAVYFVGMLLMQLSFAFGDGLQNATVAVLGKKAGAGDMHGVRKGLERFLKTGAAVAFSLSSSYIIFSDLFFGTYFDDPVAVSKGQVASIFIACISFFQIERIIIFAALRSVGEMKLPRQITSFCVTIFNPATSFIFSYVLGLEITGVWLSMLLTQIIWGVSALVKGKKYLWKSA